MSGLINAVRAGAQQTILKFSETAIHPTIQSAAASGFVLGMISGLLDPDPEPDRIVETWNAVNTAFLLLDTVFVKGALAADRTSVEDTMYKLVPVAATRVFLNQVAGAGFLAVAFAGGFTAGYAIGNEGKRLFKAL